MRMTSLALSVVFAAAAEGSGASAGEFRLAFEWGDIPLCTSGRPNIVPNPIFVLQGVPPGTTSIQFQMKDLDVPSYDHGGSPPLAITSDGTVPPGVFTYKSPCPPGGRHTYEWTATARAGDRVIGQAKARRKYPE